MGICAHSVKRAFVRSSSNSQSALQSIPKVFSSVQLCAGNQSSSALVRSGLAQARHHAGTLKVFPQSCATMQAFTV